MSNIKHTITLPAHHASAYMHIVVAGNNQCTASLCTNCIGIGYRQEPIILDILYHAWYRSNHTNQYGTYYTARDSRTSYLICCSSLYAPIKLWTLLAWN